MPLPDSDAVTGERGIDSPWTQACQTVHVTPRPLTGRARRHGADRHTGGWSVRSEEWLVVEQPVAIDVDGTVVATTMCTPDDLESMAIGFCVAEGLLGAEVIPDIASVDDDGVTTVRIATGRLPGSSIARLGVISSSCGVCGTADMGALVRNVPAVSWAPAPPDEIIAAAAGSLRSGQEVFALTGGSHAASAVDPDGRVVEIAEDVGRHNAVDKVVGRLHRAQRLPAVGWTLVVSGRASFEMVQKACAAGFGTLVAVSAPSSLAVDAASRAGLRLVGFARDDRFTIYVSGDPDPRR